ncbi:uncharacterized protein YdeI (BOF family) [Actimicrobium sp. GrIS 1.19]|uniref:hypothetical protein n=1 Tax=Actimicrobium sp. GrIS 1.19 TaxID=3071708 RepID=UPI002DFAC5C3|nr:uncharacterized protein YdeI (BOF family) [Actimicrobium sp. GrIS 1.19]
MKKSILLALFLAVAAPVFAASNGAPNEANCAAQAETRSGSERTDFIEKCLNSGKLSAKQQKKADCRAEGKDLKGAEKKSAYKACLAK